MDRDKQILTSVSVVPILMKIDHPYSFSATFRDLMGLYKTAVYYAKLPNTILLSFGIHRYNHSAPAVVAWNIVISIFVRLSVSEHISETLPKSSVHTAHVPLCDFPGSSSFQ